MINTKQINDLRLRIGALTEQRRLREAFALLRNTARAASAPDIDDAAAALEQNYAYMLRYLTDGMDDPDRERVYADIVSGLYTTLDTMVRRITAAEAPTLYYNKLRYRIQHPTSLEQTLREGDSNDVFEALWTTYPLTVGDVYTITDAFMDADTSRKLVMISAVTFALLEFYDERALLMLIDLYSRASDDVVYTDLAVRALTGILLALYRHRKRGVSRAVRAALNVLNDNPLWRSDVRMAFIEFIRTRDTERISRTMTEDIIPKMTQMDPAMMQRLRQGFETESFEDMAENPEWSEFLDKSGITDRLKQLSELQAQGGDVFMATFSHLKMFPFFNDPAAWFKPFRADEPNVRRAGLDSNLTRLIEAMPMLCDNDKYSFVFALAQVPESQRSFMLSQISLQNEQMLEEIKHATEADLPAERRRRSAANYLQGLNRFFKLFRRKGEFRDPFADKLNLLKVDALAGALDLDTTRAAAEFFLKVQMYDDALDAFMLVDAQGEPDAEVFEKLGWINHKLGRHQAAIDYYQQAELFHPDNIWLLKQLVRACRDAGDTVQAVDYARRVAEASAPDDVRATLQLGYAYLQNKQYDKALNEFYKVEFTSEKPTNALRPIAWTLFLKGDFERATRYYERIMADSPRAEDYLNMGHNALGAKRIKEAINFYLLSRETSGSDAKQLLASINADRPAIAAAGIDDATLALVTDALLYSL